MARLLWDNLLAPPNKARGGFPVPHGRVEVSLSGQTLDALREMYSARGLRLVPFRQEPIRPGRKLAPTETRQTRIRTLAGPPTRGEKDCPFCYSFGLIAGAIDSPWGDARSKCGASRRAKGSGRFKTYFRAGEGKRLSRLRAGTLTEKIAQGCPRTHDLGPARPVVQPNCTILGAVRNNKRERFKAIPHC